jgi:uncharacterized protein YcfL
MKHLVLIILAAFFLAGCITSCKKSSSTDQSSHEPTDTPLLSFVIFGDSRVNWADTNVVSNPSAANVEELKRSYEDIAALDPRPDFVFFNGDAGIGHIEDSVYLEKQLNAWVDIYKNSQLPGLNIKLYACPGNHEFTYEAPGGEEFLWLGAETTWLKCMKPYAADSNGPHAGGPDSLLTDQSWLTYSFDLNGAHFIVVNTDTWDVLASYPYYWIVDDMEKAHQNAATKQIFIINHRPVHSTSYNNEPEDVADPHDSLLWEAMESNHVIAMFSSHIHHFAKEQINNKSWQVIIGNAGAELSKGMPADMNYFGFIVVTVTSSGNIIMKAMGRNVPAGGYLEPPDSPTTVRDSVNIAW